MAAKGRDGMAEPTELTRKAMAELQSLSAAPASPEALYRALRFLAKWRSQLLANTVVHHSGTRILSGPFAGMDYPVRAAEGARAARLLGAYEASLDPVIERIVARAYPLVIDIGCAEGYYAVGLARRMPESRILARDTSERAQALCRDLAAANGVSDRVEVGGLFSHGDFDCAREQDTVVICDIEGAEAALLDPSAAPGLLAADILVEVHEGPHPGLADTLTARFAASHHATRFDRLLAPERLPPWAETLSDLDRLLLLWEWRAAPTPWLWLERRR
jgi:SAM-dependent methyltransferase